MVLLLLLFALLSNGINLVLPKIVSNSIDALAKNYYVLVQGTHRISFCPQLSFYFTYLGHFASAHFKKVLWDLRTQLAYKISVQSRHAWCGKYQVDSKTADQSNCRCRFNKNVLCRRPIVSIASSVIIIIGACIMLSPSTGNWHL